MRSAQTFLAILAFLFVAHLSGCQSAPSASDGHLVTSGRPSDFALRLHVLGDNSGDDPAAQTSQYVLESDRILRAAVGAGATPEFFPGPSRRVTPAEMDALWRVVHSENLLSEPTSAAGESFQQTGERQGLIYTVRVTAGGSRHDFVTTSAESPGTRKLALLLLELRGDRQRTD